MSDAHADNGEQVARLKRLLNIVPLARRKEGIPLDKLQALLNCGIDVIFNDVRLLIMCGVPPYGPSDYLQAFIEDGSLHINFADHFARPVRLSAEEYAALVCAIEYAGDLVGSESRRVADALLSKLSAARRTACGFTHSVVPAYRMPADKFSLIQDCIASCNRMDVSYYSAGSDAVGQRVIHPYAILAHSHHWYVAAHDEKRGEVRLFRGDRLLGVRKTAERFERPGDFDARRFFASRVHSDNAPAITVKVLFRPEYTRFIAERFPSGAIKRRADGSAEVTMKADNISWAARWVLKHGTYARALYPKELVDEVKKRCDEMCALYE